MCEGQDLLKMSHVETGVAGWSSIFQFWDFDHEKLWSSFVSAMEAIPSGEHTKSY